MHIENKSSSNIQKKKLNQNNTFHFPSQQDKKYEQQEIEVQRRVDVSMINVHPSQS